MAPASGSRWLTPGATPALASYPALAVTACRCTHRRAKLTRLHGWLADEDRSTPCVSLPSATRHAAILALAIIAGPTFAAAGPVRSGEQIYRQQCASCHGSSGEGTDEHYPRALVGERSVDGLARLIAKTMPEDAPGDCVGEDAEKVAAYIYDSFYSKSAQARNKFQPPRIELSRLDRPPVQERDCRPARELSGPGPLG